MVCVSAGLRKKSDFHETWYKDVSQERISYMLVRLDLASGS